MTTVSFKIPKRLLDRVKRECRARGVTQSALVREALENSLSRDATDRQLTGFDLIEDLVGIAKNAPRDLATNPKYMEGYGE